ncbi:MAG TPA: hypothetical protein VJR04_10830 [Terriglobales bacterium]|nr:hypothetical protein [Terriglobales bacterium]
MRQTRWQEQGQRDSQSDKHEKQHLAAPILQNAGIQVHLRHY